jgi:hypothetical protein
MRDAINTYKILLESQKETAHSKDVGIDGRIILK